VIRFKQIWILCILSALTDSLLLQFGQQIIAFMALMLTQCPQALLKTEKSQGV
jgi:hypothetical protein